MAEKETKFLADLASGSADVRFAAWRAAGEMDASVIPQVAKLADTGSPGVAKAAREALTTMAHSVGKSAGDARRAAVVKGLLGWRSAHALRLLSGIAGEDAVPGIAKYLADAELREEAAFALERIPGAASDKALMAAYKDAKDDFKPRILYALGHRRTAEAAGMCAEAMKSSNVDIAMAGTKAYGRIGKKAAGQVKFPDPAGLNAWQQVDRMDAMLRYADTQAAEGNAAEAMRVYKMALDRTEEHWQCAGVIGLAKMNSAEAAAMLFPKMKSENARVRITARKAWASIAKA